MYIDYPGRALNDSIDDALRYRMLDLKRLERMVLARIGKDFFRRSTDDHHDER